MSNRIREILWNLGWGWDTLHLPLKGVVVIVASWRDSLTRIKYDSRGRWRRECLEHLAQLVVCRLAAVNAAGDEELTLIDRSYKLANELARFWEREYYRLLFPLRFGLQIQREGEKGADRHIVELQSPDPFGDGRGTVDLDDVLDRWDSSRVPGNIAFRSKPLEEGKLPPILPLETVPGSDASEELLPERLLMAGFIAASAVRYKRGNQVLPLNSEAVSAVRLGIFASPFCQKELAGSKCTAPIEELLRNVPGAYPIALFLGGSSDSVDEIPAAIRELMPPLRNWLKGGVQPRLPAEVEGIEVRFVVAAPQRIQKYIFESPGLAEIRGASALLEDVITKLRDAVAQEDGYEAIIRSAASTIEFLTLRPGPTPGTDWGDFIKREFYETAGAVRVAAGEASVTLGEILRNWRKVSGEAWAKLQRDRNRAEVPAADVLPFEARCDLCKMRAASESLVDQEGTVKWVCASCSRKISKGRRVRGRALDFVSALDISPQELLSLEDGSREDARSLNELPAENARYEHTAVIFGDGNNFGAIVQKLNEASDAIQWSRRISAVTSAAAAMALVISLVEDRRRGLIYRHMPCEVLTLGGDDISFITAGTLALRFSYHLMRLTDREFEVADGVDVTPITYSFGVVVCDAKAPVRVVADWADEHAIKKAKRALRESQSASKVPMSGTLAFIVANTIENLPSDWDAYERELNHSVMQPFTTRQIGFLLDIAERLGKHQSLVHSLARAFRVSSPHAAILHYLYQRGRARGTEKEAIFEALEAKGEHPWEDIFGYVFPWDSSIPWDSSGARKVVEPFTELLQVMKAIQVTGGGGRR